MLVSQERDEIALVGPAGQLCGSSGMVAWSWLVFLVQQPAAGAVQVHGTAFTAADAVLAPLLYQVEIACLELKVVLSACMLLPAHLPQLVPALRDDLPVQETDMFATLKGIAKVEHAAAAGVPLKRVGARPLSWAAAAVQ